MSLRSLDRLKDEKPYIFSESLIDGDNQNTPDGGGYLDLLVPSLVLQASTLPVLKVMPKRHRLPVTIHLKYRSDRDSKDGSK